MTNAVSDSIIESATATACAKINLTLGVQGRREDGFHELRSLVIGVDLRDELHSRTSDELGFVLKCTDPDLAGSDNLVSRAVHDLAAHSGYTPSLQIELRKRIPIGAGMGGGSSDAAATLCLCNQLWGLGLDGNTLATVGAGLGSDVPLFFSLPAAIVTGRGERVEAVTMRWSGWALLVCPRIEVPTAEVYARWQKRDSVAYSPRVDEAIRNAGSADEISALVTNDLEEAVFRVSPGVARIHHRLSQLDCGRFTITGSGSAMYRLFDSYDAACHAASEIDKIGLDVVTAVAAAPVGQDPINMNEED
jgi:4-diphosphocytidyl-2-C-methyl-D-erythritol kinase